MDPPTGLSERLVDIASQKVVAAVLCKQSWKSHTAVLCWLHWLVQILCRKRLHMACTPGGTDYWGPYLRFIPIDVIFVSFSHQEYYSQIRVRDITPILWMKKLRWIVIWARSYPILKVLFSQVHVFFPIYHNCATNWINYVYLWEK